MAQSTRPARGMRDFLPSEIRRREYVIGVIRESYEIFGFEPLETPALENLETLLGQYGDESGKLLFKIGKRGVHEHSGDVDLALRYDLTVPLARVVAEHRDRIPKPFKRYQIQPVWRADRPARGRFREFYQCDVDIVGTASIVAEVELCAAVTHALKKLGFEDFRIRLNHRGILTGMLEAAGIPPDQHDEALIALDKLDRIGESGLREELGTRTAQESAGKLIDWLSDMGVFSSDLVNNERVLDKLDRLLVTNPSGHSGADEISEILRLSKDTEAGRHLDVSPSLARGLSYYTGAVMEIAAPGLGVSIGGGGRYDQLIGRFLGIDVPACGFSLGLERLLVIMEEASMFPSAISASSADVLVARMHPDAVHSLTLAAELRKTGLRVDLYPEPAKLGKQFNYALDKGIRVVALVGEDEIKSGLVTVRDLQTRSQAPISRPDLVSKLRRLLSAEATGGTSADG